MGKLLYWFLWFKPRLLEPSTFASLAAICTMFGVNLDTSTIHDFLNIGTLVFGSLGVFVSEGTPSTIVK